MRNTNGARALSSAMRDKGMTQSALAAAVGADQGSVSRWLRGQRVPGVRYALALREALGVDVDVWTPSPRKRASARRAVGG